MASFWYITLITIIDVITNSENFVNASISLYIIIIFYEILFILLFIFYHGHKVMSRSV